MVRRAVVLVVKIEHKLHGLQVELRSLRTILDDTIWYLRTSSKRGDLLQVSA